MTALIRQSDRSVLVFDVVEQERYDEGADVTEHAVESGAPISDHSRTRSPTVTLTARMTESPLAYRGGPAGPARLIAALAWLRASMGEPVDVVSARLGTVRGCLITAIPHEIGPSRSMPITVSLRQVRLADAEFVRIPPSRPVARVAGGQADGADGGWQTLEALWAGDASLVAIGSDFVTAGLRRASAYLGGTTP